MALPEKVASQQEVWLESAALSQEALPESAVSQPDLVAWELKDPQEADLVQVACLQILQMSVT